MISRIIIVSKIDNLEIYSQNTLVSKLTAVGTDVGSLVGDFVGSPVTVVNSCLSFKISKISLKLIPGESNGCGTSRTRRSSVNKGRLMTSSESGSSCSKSLAEPIRSSSADPLAAV